MSFGQDDDTLLIGLLNNLEIDSALYRLERVGFKLITSMRRYHLSRPRENVTEDIFIEVNDQNHFIVHHASNGLFAAYTDIITTWDEWVTFVRLLVLRGGKRNRSIQDAE